MPVIFLRLSGSFLCSITEWSLNADGFFPFFWAVEEMQMDLQPVHLERALLTLTASIGQLSPEVGGCDQAAPVETGLGWV